MSVTVFPVRLLLMFFFMLLAWPFAFVASLGRSEFAVEPQSWWRRCVPALNNLNSQTGNELNMLRKSLKKNSRPVFAPHVLFFSFLFLPSLFVSSPLPVSINFLSLYSIIIRWSGTGVTNVLQPVGSISSEITTSVYLQF